MVIVQFEFFALAKMSINGVRGMSRLAQIAAAISHRSKFLPWAASDIPEVLRGLSQAYATSNGHANFCWPSVWS